MRLAANLPKTAAGTKGKPNELTLSQAPGDRWWSANDNKSTPDQVVVTTTDYLPGHSEKLTIRKLKGTTLSFWIRSNIPITARNIRSRAVWAATPSASSAPGWIPR